MNQLKIINRNIKKNPLLTVLRSISILLGVGVALYIFELTTFEKSYDSFWENADNIYRVSLIHKENGELITHSAKNFLGAPNFLKAECPQIEAACGFNKDVITVFCNEQQFNNVDWLWSDTSFFSVLNRPIIQAESNDIWNDVHGVSISKSFSQKLFGDSNPINQKFKLNEGWEFYVKAVFDDIPQNSHIGADVIGSRKSLIYYMQNFNNATRQLSQNSDFYYSAIAPYNRWSWSTPFTYRRFTYIKLASNTNINQVKSLLPKAFENIQFPVRYAQSDIEFDFQPIKSIHLTSDLEQEYKANGNTKRVSFLNLIATVILLVSCINFLNLTNIQTIKNGRLFAIQKINGAKQSSLLSHIITDNFLITLLSASLGILIVYLFRDVFLPTQTIHIHNLATLLIILILISIISMVIPYFSAISGKFETYIKSQNRSLPGTWNGRKSMVIVQFTIAILLISGTLLINKQMKYMSDYKLGFKPQQTMFSFSPMSMNMSPEILPKLIAFNSEIKKVPGVESFSVSSSVPGNPIKRVNDNIRIEESADPLAESFKHMSASTSFLNVFDIQLLAGRNFIQQSNWESNEILINQSALKAMGFSNANQAVGQMIYIGNEQKQIVGIINNYNHVSLKQHIQPLIISQNLNWDYAVGYYTIKFNAARTKQVIKSVSDIWETIYPIEVASFNFTDDVFNHQYRAEQKFKRITTYGSLLALFISCIGLFAIAAFDTQKRIKEIGVRKVNGAKIQEILLLLNSGLIKWVLLAFFIATPIAYYVMHKWLENFAYKTTLSWWIFALAGAMALGIALLTVSWQSWRAATRNPVDALRYE